MQSVVGLNLVGELMFLLSLLFFLPLAVLCAAFWIWMLVDCAVNEPSEGNEKIVWILVILFAHLLGALIYFLARRPQRKARYGR